MGALGPEEWQAINVTLRLCLYTSVVLMMLATPIAWWLANGRSRLKGVVQSVVSLPLVLPPTVLGFYLLITLGPRGLIGGSLEQMGLNHLAFSFEGILIASVIYSLPFAVQPLTEAFRNIGRRPVEVASSLGANALDRFRTVIFPLSRGGYLVAATLTFAHTLGEFGVILMLGGSIPGETRVLSVLIYDHAEAMNYEAAHSLSLLILVFAFVTLWLVYSVNRRFIVARI
ncbi:molybdate ABC transporter permease subunit [Marinobacter similis]|uniref:Molybdenum transport system permease n=1 Tax=Marinobacter similis TaxID=1420916 RepID=W5YSL0_9GAMM|nr:molybdate ABC transporter permease subunit [Marinobacter similis]AHI29428.1 molybdenum ABC transporter permease [Marinobacter similis]